MTPAEQAHGGIEGGDIDPREPSRKGTWLGRQRCLARGEHAYP